MKTSKQLMNFHKKFTKQMHDITARKNSDYTGANHDPFANFRSVETLGICTTEQGFLTRMMDKMARISSFAKNGELQVKDESVTDTLQDLANYCILMAAYIESKK